jgi:predicted NAD/FAD-dependent oxidoreductase
VVTDRTPRVAVIGAGIAGVACARLLAASGLGCTVFEKSRGAGGRAATRRLGGASFDHGAPFIGPPEPGQDVPLAAWLATGLVASWRPAGGADDRLLAVPGMSSLAGALAVGLEVRTGVRVGGIERQGDVWRLGDDAGNDLGGFDAVVVAVPAPQAAPLLAGAPDLAARAALVRFAPRWAAMFAFDRPLESARDIDEPAEGGLALLVRDSAKPGRPPGERWVVHATASWSAIHLEDDATVVAGLLLDALRVRLAVAAPEPRVALAHRWRYAEPATTVGAPFLLVPAVGLGACGDWCAGGRIAGAWTSGSALATALVAGLAGR